MMIRNILKKFLVVDEEFELVPTLIGIAKILGFVATFLIILQPILEDSGGLSYVFAFFVYIIFGVHIQDHGRNLYMVFMMVSLILGIHMFNDHVFMMIFPILASAIMYSNVDGAGWRDFIYLYIFYFGTFSYLHGDIVTPLFSYFYSYHFGN